MGARGLHRMRQCTWENCMDEVRNIYYPLAIENFNKENKG